MQRDSYILECITKHSVRSKNQYTPNKAGLGLPYRFIVKREDAELVLLLTAYCVSSKRFGFWCEISYRNFSPAATFFFFFLPLLFVALWINTCLYPCLCAGRDWVGREVKDTSSYGTCMGAWRKKIIWNEMDEKKKVNNA